MAYIVLVCVYLHHWKALPVTIVPKGFQTSTSITVIIPIRNEADHIAELLESIRANHYPSSLLEIIVVDDHSTDSSTDIIKSFKDSRIKVLSLSNFELPSNFNSFKKFGIGEAVKQAKGELIITTDGDCVVPLRWLEHFAYCFEVKKKKFIAAPVNFHYTKSALGIFQCLDFMGMMLVTGANIQRNKSLMCNGANMGYSKALFMSIGGYSDIQEQASGDDVMLLNKVAESRDQEIGFIKNEAATVLTHGASDWSTFVQQRLRWATKNSSSKDVVMKLELGIVYLLCCAIFFLILYCVVNFSIFYFFAFVVLVASKFIMDYILLRRAAHFFEKRKLLGSYYISFVIHVFYIAYIGTLSLFKKKYNWKGRVVR